MSSLRARHELRLEYERSVGGATGAFLAGLTRREILGSRGPDGRVSVPPVDGGELVAVSPRGAVRRWSWVASPTVDQPLDRPFAYALVQLDGADTCLLHVVEPADRSSLSLGARVRADWRTERVGSVLDIRAFVPDDGASAPPPGGAPVDDIGDIRVRSSTAIVYAFDPGATRSAFYTGLADGRILGGRCTGCAAVHVPPRPACPVCGTRPMAPVELPPTGTVAAMTVVHLPVPGADVEPPFAFARIRLDGTDVAFPHLLSGSPLGSLHVGQRVVAVWAPVAARPSSWEAISHFRPVDA